MPDDTVAVRALSIPAPSKPTPTRRRFGRFNIEIRQDMAGWRQTAIIAASIVVGLIISGAILVATGVDASELLDELIVETFFDAANLRSVLTQAAPLILVGLSASVAFRARFWNLGIEGQMIWGGLGATLITIFHVGPEATRLPLMFLAAIAAGMAWIAIAAVMKTRFRVNEIISTLLMNYIAFDFLLHLVYGAWQDPRDGFPHSPPFQLSERLPDFGGGVSSGLLLALLLTVIAGWLVHLSRFGFYTKFVQANPRMALGVGVPIASVTLGSVLFSGGLAAMGGFVMTAGQEGRLTQSFFEGYGFAGILIAFLARNNPFVALIVALMIADLFVMGRSLQVFYQIPFSMVQLIEAIIVICVAASEFIIRHRVHWIR